MTRPLPMTLLDDVKIGCGALVVVAVGTSVFYLVKGTVRSSSKGCRVAGGVQAVISNGHLVRRRAAYSGIFMGIDAIMFDQCDVRAPLAMAVAGGATNALFSMDRGAGAAARSGLKGAAFGGVAWIAINNIIRFFESH